MFYWTRHVIYVPLPEKYEKYWKKKHNTKILIQSLRRFIQPNQMIVLFIHSAHSFTSSHSDGLSSHVENCLIIEIRQFIENHLSQSEDHSSYSKHYSADYKSEVLRRSSCLLRALFNLFSISRWRSQFSLLRDQSSPSTGTLCSFQLVREVFHSIHRAIS